MSVANDGWRWLEINNPTIGEDAGIEMIKGQIICNLHFKLEDYDRNLFGMTRHALKQTAVPSVFTVGLFPDDEQASASNAPPAALHCNNFFNFTFRLPISMFFFTTMYVV